MIVLSVADVRKHYGPEPVLDGVTFDVHSGERIGLVGPNGSGKTTLMKILAGKEDADAGSAVRHPSVDVGYLEQQPDLPADRTVWDEAAAALAPLLAIQHEALEVARALADTPAGTAHQRLAARYDHLQHELERHDAYNLDHKIERVLEGLGFREEAFRLPIAALSGGEQNRLILARILLAGPDLMLLDEPSNHLDIEATEWLESYLTASHAAMIVVSHDRYFLDKVTTDTLELFHGTVDRFAGNFSAYWRQKEERLLVEQRTYERQRTEIAKMQDFIRRNAYGQKHAQAKDRERKLERIEPVAPPRQIEAPHMTLPKVERSGDIVLRVTDLAKAYDRVLFNELSFEIYRGQRWAILGPNGSGKSTLLKCLLGEITPDGGRVTFGAGVEPGYFDQHLDSLADDARVVDAIRPDRVDFPEQRRRDLLARFGITADTALQPVASLSGGERCRAALARLAATDANFLILDEPTNHLDLWARDALERAIKTYEGTVLFVSHDRYFVNQVADHLLLVEPERFRTVEGNYQTYLDLVQQRAGEPPPGAAAAQPAREPRATPSTAAEPAARRKRRFPYRKVADIEQEIFAREGRIEELHATLADPAVLRDGDRVRQIKNEVVEQQQTLETLYAHWEEANEFNH